MCIILAYLSLRYANIDKKSQFRVVILRLPKPLPGMPLGGLPPILALHFLCKVVIFLGEAPSSSAVVMSGARRGMEMEG